MSCLSDRWLKGMIRPAGASVLGRGPIVKLGGSLLTRPSWPEDVVALVASLAGPVLVVGGGPIVDGLRRIDAARPQPPALMHALAIEAMRLTARIVADTLGLSITPTIDPDATGPTVLDAAAWLESHPAASSIPPGWEVTSDSIAAAMAVSAGRHLLLVKSRPPPCPGDELAALSAAGWVDEHFPAAAAAVTGIDWAAPEPVSHV